MSENEINQDAAAALIRVVNIQELARGLSSDLLLCFGDCCRPRFSSVFELVDGVQCLEEIKELADGAIKALEDLGAAGV